MNFTPEFVKLAKRMKLTPEQLWASQSQGKETINTKGSTIAATTATAEKLAANAAATTATAAKMRPEDFVTRAIRKLRGKEGETYEVTKIVLGPDGNPVVDDKGKIQRVKTGERKPMPKGINARIDLNPAIREYYGKDTDCRKLTEDLEKAGVIVIKPIRGSVMVYLPEDRPVSNRKSRLAEVLAD